MRTPVFLAGAVMLCAGLMPFSVEATTLRYDFDYVVTSISYTHECHDEGDCDRYEARGDATTYQGPTPQGGAGRLFVEILESYGSSHRIDLDYSDLGLPEIYGDTWMESDDPRGGVADMQIYNGYDGLFFDIAPGAGRRGSGYISWEQDGSGADWATIDFEFHDVTVSSVPLPATLPLLLAGALGLGAIGRRRHATRAT